MRLFLILIVLLFVQFAGATVTMFAAPTVVSVNGTSAKKLNQNTKRVYLLIQNLCSVGVIVKMGSVQTGTEGILIPANGNYEPQLAPGNSIYAETVSGTGTSCLTFIEGQ